MRVLLPLCSVGDTGISRVRLNEGSASHGPTVSVRKISPHLAVHSRKGVPFFYSGAAPETMLTQDDMRDLLVLEFSMVEFCRHLQLSMIVRTAS